jgi:hypothetical protein
MTAWTPPQAVNLVDLGFMDSRSKLIDLAAFLDRVDRGDGDADFRFDAFKRALTELSKGEPTRARDVLLSLSDPSEEPIPKSPGKGAIGAYAAPAK